MPYPADWRVTSHCTLSCDFCYGPVPGKDPVHLRSSIACALIDSSVSIVTFCGGEPLLVREVGDYATRLHEAGKRTVLNTNGSLLRQRIDAGMPMDFDVVGLSLDGSTEAMHREMRGTRADFHAVWEAAKIIASYPNITLKIATVVSRVNRRDILSLAEQIRGIGPGIWRLYQYVPLGPYNRGRERHELSVEDFLEIAESAREAAAPVQVFSSTAHSQGTGCLIISMDGAVFQATSEGDVIHGNCLDSPLDQIWHDIENSQGGQLIVQNKGWHDLVLRNLGPDAE
jgi:MoaA/NifB/PqqE/SkfB family radical SAM enzyme